MNGDCLLDIVKEMRITYFIEGDDAVIVNNWADRLEALALGIEADCAELERLVNILRG